MLNIMMLVRGEMPEWSNGADSKSVVPFEVPRVRIPLSPPKSMGSVSIDTFLSIYSLSLPVNK